MKKPRLKPGFALKQNAIDKERYGEMKRNGLKDRATALPSATPCGDKTG